LKKIIILTNDPFSSASFTTEQQEHFKQRILDSNDINSLTPGGNFIKENMILIGDDWEGVYYILREDGFGGKPDIVAEPGVIVVAPSDQGSRADSKTTPGAKITYGGTVYLGGVGGQVSQVLPELIGKSLSHEFGHIIMGEGHPKTIYEDTVMTYKSGRPPSVGPADKKQAMILNTDDYVIFPDEQFPKIDWIGNILGLYKGKEDAKVNVNEQSFSEEYLLNPLKEKNDY